MPAVKLSQTEMQYITILQGIVNNVVIEDCIVDEEDNKVVFVVSEGQAGLAIGKRGANINRLKEIIRIREVLADTFLDNDYNSSDKDWNNYFLAFNYAARN